MQQFRELPSTTGSACVQSVHQDDFGGLWLEANDGDKVVVPFKVLQRFRDIVLKAVKYVPPLKREETQT